MKAPTLACLLCFLVVQNVPADLTVVQKVEGMGQSYENTSLFKDGKIRVDTSPGASLILDGKTGEIISLNRPQKTYLKTSGDPAREAATGARETPADRSSAPPPLTPTGKKEVISGYEAEEYTCRAGGVKLSLWLTKALPDYQAALKELDAGFQQGPTATFLRSYGLGLSALPGFPVRTVLEVKPGETMTRTVVSANTRPIPDAEFQVPSDYQEAAATTLTPPAADQPVPNP